MVNKKEKSGKGFFASIQNVWLCSIAKLQDMLSGKKKMLVFLGTWSAILNYLLESSLRENFLLGIVHIFFQLPIFLLNTLLIFASFSVILFFRRRVFYFTTVSVLWIVLAISNLVVLMKRNNTPLNAPDLRVLRSAFEIIPEYLNGFQQFAVLLLIITAIVLLGLIFLKDKKMDRNLQFASTAFALTISVTVLVTSVFSSYVSSSHFSQLPSAYREYGFVFSFFTSLIDTGIDKPDNYSDEVISALEQQLNKAENVDDVIKQDDDIHGVNSDSADNPDIQSSVVIDDLKKATEEHPNIIFIQLESFYDPMNIDGLSFSEDPMPNYRNILENYSSGKVSVPSIGAGTANTEFEVITGMDIDYFGVAEYPYLSILQNNTCESLAYNLKEYGYNTHAMHNHTGTFYDRNIVFPNLGFDTYTAIQNMKNIVRNDKKWAMDSMLLTELRGCLASTPGEADFIYAISVQCHGQYPSSFEEFNEIYGENSPAHIVVTGNENDPEKPGVDYWINQVYEVDAFIGSLVNYFESCDEPTVVVMYGDHLPAFSLETWKLKDGDLYQTQGVIWSNFDIGEKENFELYSYKLGSYVLGKLGFESGYINKLHNKYFGTDTDYSKELQLLQYDMLYGEKKIFNGENVYLPTNIKYGYDTAKIEKVSSLGNTVFVNGGIFNNYSYIYINGNKKNTAFINNTCISCSNTELNDGDVIKIVQLTKGGESMGESLDFVYKEPEGLDFFN